jgi:hypothetical protein
MQQCGYRRVATYEAVAIEMRRFKIEWQSHFELRAEAAAKLAAFMSLDRATLVSRLAHYPAEMVERWMNDRDKIISATNLEKLDNNPD